MRRSAILLILFALLPCPHVLAHDPGLSSITIHPRANGIDAALTFASRDAAQLADLDNDHDGAVTPAEFARGQARLEAVVAAQTLIALDGKSAKAESIHSWLDQSNNVELRLTFRAAGFSKLEIESKLIGSLPPGHRQYLLVQNRGGRTVSECLLSVAMDRTTTQITAADSHEPAVQLFRSFADFLALGVKHILTGYDHLLFLFGLLVVTRSFASALRIITSFTIAHSITLAVATLGGVQIPSRIVEPLIAASIVYVGVENVFRGDDPGGRRLLTFAFGLIHGFGFASVLRDLGVGSRPGGVALPLVSFNLGVELGQMVMVMAALPIICKLRSAPVFSARWMPTCSAAVVLLGGVWFVQRVSVN